MKPGFVVTLAAIVYFFSFSAFSILEHRGLKTQITDLGIVSQAIWKASKGDLAMPVSNTNHRETPSFLAIHATFIFWLLAVAYLFWPNPETLLVLTSLFCALGGIGLYVLAKERLQKTWWVIIPPLVFWLSPMVQDANLYDFHVITLATAFLVWMIWAFDTGHKRTGWILLLLALLCKEDVSLVVFMYGIYHALRISRREGVTILLVSVFYLILVIYVLVPFFNQGKGFEVQGPGNRYGWLGSNLPQMLGTVFTRPGEILSFLLRPDRLRLPIYFLLSGAVVALRAWPMLLLLVPPLLGGMLAETTFTIRVTGTYYWIPCEAAIIVACILATPRASKAKRSRFPLPLAYLLMATLVSSLLFSPLPYGLLSSWDNYQIPPGRRTFDKMLDLIPQNAGISIQNNLGSHLAHRDIVARFPRHEWEADFALFHLRYTGGWYTGRGIQNRLGWPKKAIRAVKWLEASPRWGLIAVEDGFYLFGHDVPSLLEPEEARRRIDEDSKILLDEFKSSTSSVKALTDLINEPLDWKSFWKKVYSSVRRDA